jgi:hypothetical protein
MRTAGLVTLLALTMLSLPAQLIGQGTRRPSVDTVRLAILPTATIVRREILPSCFDCWPSFVTDISLDGVTLQVRKLDDLLFVWRRLTPLPDSAGPEAFRLRLMALLEATFLPDARPRLISQRADLNSLVQPLVERIPITSPRDSVRPDSRSTAFFVSTDHGLYRIQALLGPSKMLIVADSLVACYLCP